jgi:hypothetical protein
MRAKCSLVVTYNAQPGGYTMQSPESYKQMIIKRNAKDPSLQPKQAPAAAEPEKKRGFFGKIGKALGLGENLTLTAEELQEIIQQEFENVTKGK